MESYCRHTDCTHWLLPCSVLLLRLICVILCVNNSLLFIVEHSRMINPFIVLYRIFNFLQIRNTFTQLNSQSIKQDVQ